MQRASTRNLLSAAEESLPTKEAEEPTLSASAPSPAPASETSTAVASSNQPGSAPVAAPVSDAQESKVSVDEPMRHRSAPPPPVTAAPVHEAKLAKQPTKPLLEARPMDELVVYDFKKRSGAPLQRHAW